MHLNTRDLQWNSLFLSRSKLSPRDVREMRREQFLGAAALPPPPPASQQSSRSPSGPLPPPPPAPPLQHRSRSPSGPLPPPAPPSQHRSRSPSASRLLSSASLFRPYDRSSAESRSPFGAEAQRQSDPLPLPPPALRQSDHRSRDSSSGREREVRNSGRDPRAVDPSHLESRLLEQQQLQHAQLLREASHPRQQHRALPLPSDPANPGLLQDRQVEKEYRENYESLLRLNEARYLAERLNAESAAAAAAAASQSSSPASLLPIHMIPERTASSQSPSFDLTTTSAAHRRSRGDSEATTAGAAPRGGDTENEATSSRGLSADSELGRSSLAQRVMSQMTSATERGININCIPVKV